MLSGQKAWISNGGVVALLRRVRHRRPGGRPPRDHRVPARRRDEGLRCGPPIRKVGQRAIINTELFLDDVFVADDRRLGDEGQGFVGLMRRSTARGSRSPPRPSAWRERHWSTRPTTPSSARQFGKPIAEHQAVAFRLADMALRVDSARLLTWRAAQMIDSGVRVTSEAAMAKLAASETAMWCTWAAVQTLGGWGYSREYPVQKWMRDAKLEEIEEGTSDIQRLVISARPAALATAGR